MKTSTAGGESFRQAQQDATHAATFAQWPPEQLPVVFVDIHGAARVVGVSVRSFHDLRRAGLVPEPLRLGPRALRWDAEELIAHVRAKATRGGLAPPAHLSTDEARAKRAATRAARKASLAGVA